MGCFKEQITLTNDRDKVRVECGVLEKVRSTRVKAVADTGAWTLIINEKVRQRLGLNIEGKMKSALADGSVGEYGLTGPVEVKWKNRRSSHDALVVPGAREVLLGALPLEGLDLMVDPVNRRLVGIHGDEAMYLLY